MTDRVSVGFCWLEHGKGLSVPRQQSAGAAGVDLLAALGIDDDVALAPGQRALVPCGFSLALPEGFEAQVRPRSGLAAKFGVTVLNAPGTIDSDYRGEVQVILINHGDRPFPVRRGDRIAQMVIAPVTAVDFRLEEKLDETARGAKGFGSTGHSA
ncbi:deoxyuridine 5'-triphosphate nucleotidohydrolase [Youhaiella tibetensis]|uniref:Deoxyuridine 5'-triphosphate nucleotidohydrolase n=1 Tax=Paradevosia tibetensis TaxID=1447062 RepID=A0A5B9DUP3_9HYPH|nr:dUTP diphosphatase [Youhaiella tibetensis]AKR57704.1 deoxyuridine 5'-triphosphatenucleotidohydrolase [Devosia sp. H5989]QEE22625.1 dUTP diphosphatase [Youhaiella tibetensis]GGF40407.1 deoxyuridine 5'-triphosphate nucleotidohydrolase [Youhaiella tibetensis]